LVAHLQFAQVTTQTKNCKRATKQTHQDRPKWTDKPRPKKNNEGITAVTVAQPYKKNKYLKITKKTTSFNEF
jgi:hypothetical protein